MCLLEPLHGHSRLNWNLGGGGGGGGGGERAVQLQPDSYCPLIFGAQIYEELSLSSWGGGGGGGRHAGMLVIHAVFIPDLSQLT